MKHKEFYSGIEEICVPQGDKRQMHQSCQPSASETFFLQGLAVKAVDSLLPSPTPQALRPPRVLTRAGSTSTYQDWLQCSRGSGLSLCCSLNCLGKSNLAESLPYQRCRITISRREGRIMVLSQPGELSQDAFLELLHGQ